MVREPYQPAIGGVPLRNQQNIESLKQLGKVALFSLHKGEQSPASGHDFVSCMHGNMSQPDRSLLEKVKGRLRWLRFDGHYYADWLYTRSQAKLFASFLESIQPNLILFEELWFYHYIPVARAYQRKHPDCKIILDNHNVEGLIAEARSKLTQANSLAERIELAIRPQRVCRLEASLLRQVDQLWVCSEVDAAEMRSRYASSVRDRHLAQKLVVVPNGVEIERYANLNLAPPEPTKSRSKPPTVMLLGSFGYGPNEAAARILIEEIYPKLQQSYPTIRLLLVGRGPKPWMEAVAGTHPNIVVTGQVDHVEPYLQDADVMVVPLRQGSGTRLKLLEAFAAKLPVVSTYKAAEGLAVVDGQHLLLRDEVEGMVAAIAQLLSSSTLQQRLTTSAYELVQSHYSWSVATEKIQQLLGGLALVEQESVADCKNNREKIPYEYSSSVDDREQSPREQPALAIASGSVTEAEPGDRVAVIIPLHNKAAFIARTLTSVLHQTHKPCEIIVVDDGSTDDSVLVVEAWLVEHQPQLTEARITLNMIQQAQAGPGAARNRGAEQTAAPLLAFLDADDEWMPTFLAEATQALRNHSDCMLAAFGQFRGAEKSSLDQRFKLLGIRPGSWRLPLDLPPPIMKSTVDFVFSGATVIRRSGFEALGGFYSQGGCTYGEDTYFWLQAQLRYPIYRDPKALMWYHTECSALGIWNRQAPVNPILSQPGVLRRGCPAEYGLFLEQYLAQVAIVTARRFASYGDRETARILLERFPLSRSFRADHTKANLDILLTNFPVLRSWILKAKFSG